MESSYSKNVRNIASVFMRLHESSLAPGLKDYLISYLHVLGSESGPSEPSENTIYIFSHPDQDLIVRSIEAEYARRREYEKSHVYPRLLGGCPIPPKSSPPEDTLNTKVADFLVEVESHIDNVSDFREFLPYGWWSL